MFVTPAYAQAAGGGGADIFMTLMPFILIFVIMYFLIIRPQRQQAKACFAGRLETSSAR